MMSGLDHFLITAMEMDVFTLGAMAVGRHLDRHAATTATEFVATLGGIDPYIFTRFRHLFGHGIKRHGISFQMES
jgi:hypothetical protein